MKMAKGHAQLIPWQLEYTMRDVQRIFDCSNASALNWVRGGMLVPSRDDKKTEKHHRYIFDFRALRDLSFRRGAGYVVETDDKGNTYEVHLCVENIEQEKYAVGDVVKVIGGDWSDIDLVGKVQAVHKEELEIGYYEPLGSHLSLSVLKEEQKLYTAYFRTRDVLKLTT